MEVIIVNKIPLLRRCRDKLGIKYGCIDYDSLINRLAEDIDAGKKSVTHIAAVVYGDYLYNEKTRPSQGSMRMLLLFLLQLHEELLQDIRDNSRIRNINRIEFIQTKSKISLSFRVLG